MSIRWSKSLSMSINYIDEKDADDKRKKSKELSLSFVSYSRYAITMSIKMPSGETILVDAEYMKIACEKVIKMNGI